MLRDVREREPLKPSSLVRMSRAVMLALTTEGLCIPGLDGSTERPKHAPVPVKLPELDLIVELSNRGMSAEEIVESYESRFVGSGSNTTDFLEKMAKRDLLLRDPANAPAPQFTNRLPFNVSESSISIGADDTFVISVPRLVWLQGSQFLHIDDRGEIRASFSKSELLATAELRKPLTTGEFQKLQAGVLGREALSAAEVATLLRRLHAANLVERTVGVLAGDRHNKVRLGSSRFGRGRDQAKDWSKFQRLDERVRESTRDFDIAENERELRTGKVRTRVVPVQQNGIIPPLALGMIFTYAQAYDGGRLTDYYAFYPEWLMRPSKVSRLVRRPAIFLVSNYNWSHQHNLSVSTKIRELSPTSILIHGGPNTPKYKEDCEAYLLEHPEVDIAVRGEGEETVAELLDALKEEDLARPFDRTLLYAIPGLSFRDGAKVVHTAERGRMENLDSIPSPYLTGLFDVYEETELAIIETNRGCPYSCAFCDWGSATGTRVRQFSQERVLAELEWCGTHRVAGIMCADANFGIFERDVEIAREVARLKRLHGFPRGFSVSAAKNNTRYTREIIQILVAADVMTKGSIGVQSTDAQTLRAVRRANIKLESYDELAAQFTKSGLPLWTDLMFGLPGQTYGSFKNDLQGCVDRGVFARIFMTELLVNSPMNERSYREQHKIETEMSADGIRKLVVATSSFTRSEYEQMNKLRVVFMLGDAIGMLRHFAHYARAEKGIREIDFYDGLLQAAEEAPEMWPVIRFVIRGLPSMLIPPVSWHVLAQEAARYLVERLGVADDSALQVVVEAQCAVMPTAGRKMPTVVHLAHDYSAWYAAMRAARSQGTMADWPKRAPRLRTFRQGLLEVDDPDGLCASGLGARPDGDLYGNFELRSSIARWRVPNAEKISA